MTYRQQLDALSEIKAILVKTEIAIHAAQSIGPEGDASVDALILNKAMLLASKAQSLIGVFLAENDPAYLKAAAEADKELPF